LIKSKKRGDNMQTKLDERDELNSMIDKLNLQDRQKLTIFLAGLEAGKELSKLAHLSGEKEVMPMAKPEKPYL